MMLFLIYLKSCKEKYKKNSTSKRQYINKTLTIMCSTGKGKGWMSSKSREYCSPESAGALFPTINLEALSYSVVFQNRWEKHESSTRTLYAEALLPSSILLRFEIYIQLGVWYEITCKNVSKLVKLRVDGCKKWERCVITWRRQFWTTFFGWRCPEVFQAKTDILFAAIPIEKLDKRLNSVNIL